MPSEVTWMNGVVAQFHKDYPAYAKTQVNVKWIPWTNATADWTNALASGKNAPDITELGNTETPTEASLGALANISSFVNAWSAKSDVVSGMLANDTQNGNVYGVPWFGGVRGIWYRTDQFKAAGITSPPTTWAQLVTDAQKLMAKYPGTYGIGAPSNDTDAIASFIWGAGGQIATESNGKWTATLTSPAAEAGIKFYVDLLHTDHLSPAKYVGQTELGNTGRDLRRRQRGLRARQARHVHRRPVGLGQLPRQRGRTSRNGPRSRSRARTARTRLRPSPAAPTWASGRPASTRRAAWDLIPVMDSTSTPRRSPTCRASSRRTPPR